MPRFFIKFSLITMVDLAGVPFACRAWPGTKGIAAAVTLRRGSIRLRQSRWLLRVWPGRPQDAHIYLRLVKQDESVSYLLSSWCSWSCLCSRSTLASPSRTASSSSSSGHQRYEMLWGKDGEQSYCTPIRHVNVQFASPESVHWHLAFRTWFISSDMIHH